eukprot:TRINITY_DN13241_c0_g1_i1.p1 TRINITY_DN13241_c0_g1~~TRINITY_DN13241_c0_g1_i1.p1  ORF type:complete len:150 (+),score=55.03 TRINITY_DN13241_c0_g1_i1:94-543(+)
MPQSDSEERSLIHPILLFITIAVIILLFQHAQIGTSLNQLQEIILSQQQPSTPVYPVQNNVHPNSLNNNSNKPPFWFVFEKIIFPFFEKLLPEPSYEFRDARQNAKNAATEARSGVQDPTPHLKINSVQDLKQRRINQNQKKNARSQQQ